MRILEKIDQMSLAFKEQKSPCTTVHTNTERKDRLLSTGRSTMIRRSACAAALLLLACCAPLAAGRALRGEEVDATAATPAATTTAAVAAGDDGLTPPPPRSSRVVQAAAAGAASAPFFKLLPPISRGTLTPEEAARNAATVTAAASVAAASAPQQYADILARHNSHRARHNAAALSWDEGLAGAAASWASRCVFEHDGNAGAGENLAMTSDRSAASALRQSIDMWYNEEQQYNYDQQGFSMATGHFTQVVWKSTQRLGCAIQWCDGMGGSFIVCRYSPPGNYAGEYERNVERPGSNGGGGNGDGGNGGGDNGGGDNGGGEDDGPAFDPSQTLAAGASLSSNQEACLYSTNEWSPSAVCIAKDGRVVVWHDAEGSDDWKAVWVSHKTKSSRGPFKLAMNANGNLVAQDKGRRTLWQSKTANKAKGGMAVMLNDGNLVVLDAADNAVWQTNTAFLSDGSYDDGY